MPYGGLARCSLDLGQELRSAAVREILHVENRDLESGFELYTAHYWIELMFGQETLALIL